MWKYHCWYGFIINRTIQTKKNYFIGVYIINRTLHGRLQIRNFSSRVKKKNIQRVSAEKFHISARPCNILYISRTVVGKTVHATIPNGNMRNDQYTAPAVEVKRVRGFHQGFQTPRNSWKLLLLRGVWNRWWNPKHEFLRWLLKRNNKKICSDTFFG